MKYKKNRSQLKQLTVLLFLIVALPVMLILAQQIARYRSKAADHPVSLYFSPGNKSLPPNQSRDVILDTGTTPVSFIDVTVTFDPTKIRLNGEVTTTDKLKTIIRKTTMAEANSSGRVNVVLGLSPEDRSLAPSGVISVFRIPFTSATTTPNQTTVLQFPETDLQVVDTQAGNTVITATSTTLGINITPTPTPPTSMENLIKNSSFENTSGTWYSPWVFGVINGTAATLNRDTGTMADGSVSARANVSQTGTNWYVQLYQPNISIVAGRSYKISFWAKSQVAKTVEMAVQKMISPYTQYLNQKISLTTSWQKYNLTFNPTVSDSNVKLTFMLGNYTGNTWFDSMYFGL